MSSNERIVLFIHVLAELTAGTILLLSPTIFNSDATLSHLESLRGVGNGAISIGLVGVALLNMKKTSQIHQKKVLFGIIAQYHCFVVWLQLRHPIPGMEIVAPGFHALLALYFLQKLIH